MAAAAQPVRMRAIFFIAGRNHTYLSDLSQWTFPWGERPKAVFYGR